MEISGSSERLFALEVQELPEDYLWKDESEDEQISEHALELRDKFCRICLKRVILSHPVQIDYGSIQEMFIDVTGVDQPNNVAYPTKVCIECSKKLEAAYSIKQDFLNNVEQLLKMKVEGKLEEYYECCDNLDGEESSVPPTNDENRLEVPPSPGNASDTNPSDDGTKHTAKFVYSWKELAKPPKDKRTRHTFSGLLRKRKADDSVLAQFPPTTCYVCDKTHDTIEQRDDHFIQHLVMLPYHCEQCSTTDEPIVVRSVILLNRHLMMHRLPYKCDHCYRRFMSTGSLYTHCWSLHTDNREGMTCHVCGKQFFQKRSFQAHIRRHTYKANGRYTCDVCQARFGSNMLLKRHRKLHTGEKSFKCPYCEKSFSRSCNLLTHKRTHTGERCHTCEVCGKRFADSVVLRKHQKVHHEPPDPHAVQKVDRNPYVMVDGVKNYQCKFENCTYTNVSSTAMSRHKARHNKRYACGECGKRFAEPHLVKRHHRSMHTGKVRNRKRKQSSEEDVDRAEVTSEIKDGADSGAA